MARPNKKTISGAAEDEPPLGEDVTTRNQMARPNIKMLPKMQTL
jgi:hypothetical protein